MLGEQCKSEPAEKHDGVLSAINNLDSVTEHLESLIRRIQGNDNAECDPCKVKDEPSLSVLLNTGEQSIRDYIELSHNRINEIETMLF